MRTAYVTQSKAGLDFEPLDNFASNIVFLTHREYVPVGQPGEDRESIIQEVIRNLRHYRPGKDFLVLAGNPVVMFIVGQVVGHGRHNILKWNNRTGMYDLAPVEFSNFD